MTATISRHPLAEVRQDVGGEERIREPFSDRFCLGGGVASRWSRTAL
jgi:hypothetical protein